MNENDLRAELGESADDGRTLEALRATGADIAWVRGRFAEAAEREGLVEVGYRLLDTSIGTLLLATTGVGLVYVGFGVEGEESMLEMLAERVGPRVVRSPRRLDPAAEQCEQYLAGARREFELPVDPRLATGFRGDVQRALTGIGYGSTRSYSELASDLGRPRAVRAVGTAGATNPLPLVWPCHRVLRSDGSLGGYRGGLDAKKILLEMESRRSVPAG